MSVSKKSTDESRKSDSILRRFMAHEASGGIVLMAFAAVGLIVANSPFAASYHDGLHAKIGGLSVQHWINDALMALFFLLVGLEIKREFIGGQLATWSSRVLPGLAALGGMAAPAIIYVAVNAGSPDTLRGWAIPAATDIAFALGVLSLLGSRAPISLKVMLTALAIIDDLGAVLIIALFYTAELNLPALLAAGGVVAILVGLNRMRVTALWPYLMIGAALWFLVLLSGLHATLAGVILALTIPFKAGTISSGESPLVRLEHAIHPWVAFAVVPLFGFANAGVSFAGLSAGDVLAPLPFGIAAALFVGKQVGVFGAAWAAIGLGWGSMPKDASWRQLYGVSLLCGIGFTMSLFIGLLAFADAPALQDQVRVGVLMGSLASGIAGALVLSASPRRARAKAVGSEAGS